MTDRIAISNPVLDLHLERQGADRGRPVVLVPGLGATARMFSLHHRRSLVETLQTAGHTPWTVRFGIHWRQRGQCATTLMTALQKGLASLAERGQVPDAVGHSLGGMLLMGLCARGAPIRRLVTLGSAVDFRGGHPGLHHAVRLAAVAGRTGGLSAAAGLPLRRASGLMAMLSGGRFEAPFVAGQFFPGTTDGATIRSFLREATTDLPIPLLLDLAGLFTPNGLRLDGVPLRDAVRTMTRPLLLVLGEEDRQCPAASVRRTAERVSGAHVLAVGGSRRRGKGYGHVDLITGQDAPERVFEPLLAFLED